MRRAGSSAPFFIAHYFFYLAKKFIDSVGNQLFEKSRILGFRALCLWVEVISVDCGGSPCARGWEPLTLEVRFYSAIYTMRCVLGH